MTFYKSSIIADPEGGSWEFAKKIWERLSEKEPSNYELNKVNIKEFRDGEIKPKIDKNVRKRKCFFIHDSSKNSDRWFTELAFINYTMKHSSAQEIVDVFPYLKYARQDRKDESRVPINSKVIADIVNMYATKAITLDVHNYSIQGFYDVPMDTLQSHQTVFNYIKDQYPEIMDDLVLVSPDVGGGKRAESFKDAFGAKSMAIGYKKRKEAGFVESIELTGDVKDKNVLIVDDIIDSGSTLIETAKVAKNKGAKSVNVYATHGLFNKGVDYFTKCNFIDLIMVGDTVFSDKINNDPKIKIISFVDLFAEAIDRINKGKSLSKLFE
ncbi:MAG: ribose-phosphate diphosphokinase [Nanobdellota archaeon]